MKLFGYLLVPVFLVVLCVAPVDAAKKKNKKKDAGVNGDFAGTVVSITKGENAEAPATLTIKTAGAKKKKTSDRTFTLSRGVRLESVTIAKKAFGLKSATLDDIKTGERVVIQTKDAGVDQVDRVLVIAAAGKKVK